MACPILVFKRFRRSSIPKLQAHNEREKEYYQSNPDVDESRTGNNYHLITPESGYLEQIRNRIREAGCRTRKDSVLLIGTVITASPEWIQNRSLDEQRAYFEHAAAFMEKRVGRKNLLSAVVHMDEATPHMHLCIIPVTPDNRLSASAIMGDRASLIRWQDDFYSHMASLFPDLERGLPVSLTGRRHQDPAIIKASSGAYERGLEILQAFEAADKENLKETKLELRKQLIPLLQDTVDIAAHTNFCLSEAARRTDSIRIELEQTRGENEILQNKVRQLTRELLSYQSFLPEKDREQLQRKVMDVLR